MCRAHSPAYVLTCAKNQVCLSHQETKRPVDVCYALQGSSALMLLLVLLLLLLQAPSWDQGTLITRPDPFVWCDAIFSSLHTILLFALSNSAGHQQVRKYCPYRCWAQNERGTYEVRPLQIHISVVLRAH